MGKESMKKQGNMISQKEHNNSLATDLEEKEINNYLTKNSKE